MSATDFDRILDKLENIQTTSTVQHQEVLQRMTKQETLMEGLVGKDGRVSAIERTLSDHSDVISKAKAFGWLGSSVVVAGIGGFIKHVFFGAR